MGALPSLSFLGPGRMGKGKGMGMGLVGCDRLERHAMRPEDLN
jgi:hypothetical protein